MFKKSVILIGLALLSIGLYFYVSGAPILEVHQVEVGLTDHAPSSENYYLGLKEVIEQDFRSYVGLPLWKISLTEMAELLRKISWIKEFSISRTLLGKVSVELEPEQIALLWAMPDGTVLPLSSTGKVLEPIELAAAPDLPILRSRDFSGENALMAAELIDAVADSPFLEPSNIKEVFFTHKKGFSLELFEPDVVVEMGESPYSTKVQRVEKVIQYLQKKELNSRVIDATFSKKVLVRARKGPYAD